MFFPSFFFSPRCQCLDIHTTAFVWEDTPNPSSNHFHQKKKKKVMYPVLMTLGLCCKNKTNKKVKNKVATTKREIGEERLRGVHTRKKRGVCTSINFSIFQKKKKKKKKKKNSGDCTTVATQPRQLHYSNNLSKKKKTKTNFLPLASLFQIVKKGEKK